MALFSKRQATTVEAFCSNFFDQDVFRSDIGGVDVFEMLAQTYHQSVAEADRRFERVRGREFKGELLMLRVETFCLAWAHSVHSRYALPQSMWLRRYLESRGVPEMWETLGEYNTAIARSVTGQQDGTTRTGRATIAFYNSLRDSRFDAEMNGLDETQRTPATAESIARVCNRLGSESSWKGGKVQIYLSFVLTRRLGVEDISDETRGRICAFVVGFYAGAKEALKSVKLVG